MEADVPLGAFLSGGVDSSAIVALMQSQSTRSIRTFSIGFDALHYNEAPYAKAVAKHLGTHHTELYVTASQARNVIPLLPELYDEPFADSSQIPTFLVSKMAKEHVSVALSGDGGDELFCGYNRYHVTDKLWKHLNTIPLKIRQLIASGINSIPSSSWSRFSNLLPVHKHPFLGDKLHKGARILTAESPEMLYKGLISQWANPASVVIGATEPATLFQTRTPTNLDNLSHAEQIMLLDILSFLPGDILAKVDRAAMGNSLETRMPLLDHAILEFAWKLPLNYKYHQGISKWPLRKVLYRYVPRTLIERPKMGFSIPMDEWLRGPLRDWAEALLDETRLRHETFFQPHAIRTLWHEHTSKQADHTQPLWCILAFQAWLGACQT